MFLWLLLIILNGIVAKLPRWGHKKKCNPKQIRWRGQMVKEKGNKLSRTVQAELQGQGTPLSDHICCTLTIMGFIEKGQGVLHYSQKCTQTAWQEFAKMHVEKPQMMRQHWSFLVALTLVVLWKGTNKYTHICAGQEWPVSSGSKPRQETLQSTRRWQLGSSLWETSKNMETVELRNNFVHLCQDMMHFSPGWKNWIPQRGKDTM